METMELQYSKIEREIRIAASPEVVYRVVSTPEHIASWWSDEATIDADGVGEIAWARGAEDEHIEGLVVVDEQPPNLFAFRWIYDDGVAGRGTSLLVTMRIEADGDGSVLRLTESGFRDKGWDDDMLAGQYRGHEDGWNLHLPDLAAYAAKVDR